VNVYLNLCVIQIPLGENCKAYITHFLVEVVSAEGCGGEARSRKLQGRVGTKRRLASKVVRIT
jgi:hypothetical protein